MMVRSAFTACWLAWRILSHEKGRSVLAGVGVFIAILLVFVELGFYIAVPQGGMLVYDHLRFDLLLCSKNYAFQAEPSQFPRQRLAQAAKVSGVTQVTPLLFAGAKWQDPRGGLRLDAFIIGLDPAAHPFAVESIERQENLLAQPDTMLVDDATRPIFGPLSPGTVLLLNDHKVTIGGDYHLGTGFLGIGVAVLNEANFFRLFAPRPADFVNLGLIMLAPGRKADEAAVELARALPDDVQVFTRGTLQQHEDAYWTTRTSVGLIFGSGLIVSLIVGVVVLYQTLATQIHRHLPEFVTLKAIGYTDRYLTAAVMIEAAFLVLLAFLPAVAATLAIYAQIRGATLLPVTLKLPQFVGVLTLTLLMSAIAAYFALGTLRRADPADVF